MKRLSVLELHPFESWAGPEQHVHDLIKGLLMNEHDVCLVTRDWAGADRFESICDVYRLQLKKPGRAELKHIRYLANLIKIRKIDIIHTHGGWNSWIALFATILAGRGKVVNTWHGLRTTKNNLMHRWFYNKISAIISVSEMLRQRIINNTYIDTNKLHVVHNGIDIEKFSQIPQINIRGKFNIPKESFVIGCFGRIHPEKGLEYAIKAMNLLQKQNIDVCLLLVGGGNDPQYEQNLKDLVSRYNLGDKTKFCGFTKDVASYMHAIDVMVFPSICQESCPLVLSEAMACSKPIITTGLGAQGEIVQDEVNGYIISAFSEQAIAEKVMLLAEDEDLCYRMGRNGQRIVKEYFSLEVMGKKTADIFYKCLR